MVLIRFYSITLCKKIEMMVRTKLVASDSHSDKLGYHHEEPSISVVMPCRFDCSWCINDSYTSQQAGLHCVTNIGNKNKLVN
jgi:hypothetical protein